MSSVTSDFASNVSVGMLDFQIGSGRFSLYIGGLVVWGLEFSFLQNTASRTYQVLAEQVQIPEDVVFFRKKNSQSFIAL